jgi:hypothetical protein
MDLLANGETSHADLYAEGIHRHAYRMFRHGQPWHACGVEGEECISGLALATPVILATIAANWKRGADSLTAEEWKQALRTHVYLSHRSDEFLASAARYAAALAALLAVDDSAATESVLLHACAQEHVIPCQVGDVASLPSKYSDEALFHGGVDLGADAMRFSAS